MISPQLWKNLSFSDKMSGLNSSPTIEKLWKHAIFPCHFFKPICHMQDDTNIQLICQKELNIFSKASSVSQLLFSVDTIPCIDILSVFS